MKSVTNLTIAITVKKLLIITLFLFVFTPDSLGAEKSLERYVKNLELILKNKWNTLLSPNTQSNLKTVVEFWINKKGNVDSIQMTKSSHNKDFDFYAMKSIHTSQPFDPLPDDFKGNRVKIRFTFDMKLLYGNNKIINKTLPPDAYLF